RKFLFIYIYQMKTFKIAILVGSLRKESFNRKIAKALIELAPENLSLEIIEIGNLALYNEDLEQELPIEWQQFRTAIKAVDGVLFVTPEYNPSVPAVLKNAVDVGSRPYGTNIWDGKPGAIISVTPGLLGAFGANHHLRQALVFVNVPVMAQPEAYISQVGNLLDENGKLTSDSTRDFLVKFLNAYAVWVERNAG